MSSSHLVFPQDLSNNSISSTSEEWGILEHYLMLCASTSRARLTQAWHIASKYNVDMFEQRCPGKQRLLCWVDVSSLDKENDLQNVLRRGIVVPKFGMKFAFGSLILPGLPFFDAGRASELDEYFTLGTKRIFQFLLCEIAVGNSLPVESEHDVSEAALSLPAEFDSICIQRSKSGVVTTIGLTNTGGVQVGARYTYHFPNGGPPIHINAVKGVVPSARFQYEYVVFHSFNICPRYCVQIELDPSAPELFVVPLCFQCNELPAGVWCTADEAGLCEECDSQLHESSALAARHVRIPLHERIRPNGRCFNHPSEIPNAFCSICRLPACRLCLPAHSHGISSSEKTESELDSFKTQHYNNSTMSNTNKPVPSLLSLGAAYWALAATYPIRSTSGEELVQAAQRRLNKVYEFKSLIQENLQRVEEQIVSILDTALSQLTDQIQQKAAILHGCQMEIERRLQELHWSSEFLTYLCSVLPPQDFLSAWLRHKRFNRRILKKISSASQLDDPKMKALTMADLQVEGRVELRAI